MNFIHVLSLVLSIILIFFRNQDKKIWLIVFLIFFLFSLFFSSLESYLQYKIWEYHPLSKFLLPPYQPISYFLSYAYYHFYKEAIWRFLGAFFVFLIIYFLNKIFKEGVFYYDEYYIIPILTSFIDFPLNFFLLVSGLLIIFLWHLIRTIIKKEGGLSEKISLRNYWVFLCIFFIIINIATKNRLYFLENFKP